jgi:hypothetical protein
MVSASGSLTGYWFQPLEGSFETADQIAAVYLDRVADRLRAQMIGVSTAVQRGAVADAIVNFAEANHIDLIAMCTHGRMRLKHWTLGSVAEYVLGARCARILFVRAKRTVREISKTDEKGELLVSPARAAMANTQAKCTFMQSNACK